ncbi:MAG: thrombospondin type 3 repeat-containing protein [Planctomycetota bacterium]
MVWIRAGSYGAFEINYSVSPTPLPDSDGDGVPDAQDQCPGFDDAVDTNNNGIPNGCDDSDQDGVPDPLDVCPGFDDTIDTDGNSVPDGCEDCDSDGIPNGADPLVDFDAGGSLGLVGDSTQDITFSTCDPGTLFASKLVLWTDGGNLIATSDGTRCGSNGSRLTRTLAAGWYDLGVGGASTDFSGNGNFALSYPAACPEHGEYTLTLGPPDSLVITVSVTTPGMVNAYRFQLADPQACPGDFGAPFGLLDLDDVVAYRIMRVHQQRRERRFRRRHRAARRRGRRDGHRHSLPRQHQQHALDQFRH